MTLDAAGEPSETELIARVVAGDGPAHQVLFDGHAQPAWELAVVCYRRPASAEVALRLAFGMAIVAVHRHPDFATVPFTLALRSKVRTVAPRVAKASVADDDATWTRAGHRPTPPPNRLVEVFEALSEPERAALWLSEIQGLAPPDLATVLGLTLDRAAEVLERARVDLRRRIHRVPRLERPPRPRAALLEMITPLPDGLRRRSADDWNRWLAHAGRR